MFRFGACRRGAANGDREPVRRQGSRDRSEELRNGGFLADRVQRGHADEPEVVDPAIAV
jgi:hypothetical protein